MLELVAVAAFLALCSAMFFLVWASQSDEAEKPGDDDV